MNPRSFCAANRHTSGTIEAESASPAFGILPADTPESVPFIDVRITEGVGLEPTNACARRFSRPVP
jgi:hypothetical protein